MSGNCPCGSGKPYDECCGPLHRGETTAETAEALMRARYSAYEKGAFEFLHESLHPNHRSDHDLNATRRWAEKSRWTGLEVRVVEAGGTDDDTGVVEFIASYRENNQQRKHHEIGRFERFKGAWYYVDGEMPAPETVRYDTPRVGRNEPCPCGSGKKYKKCCGKA